MYNVHIGLTNKCNQNCKHCYIKDKKEVNNNKINENTLLYSLEKIGCSIITYTYGENLLYTNFFLFAKEIAKRGLYQILISNGTLINSPEMVEKLEKNGINQVSISIDSLSKDKHDNNRGFNGSFDNAIKALALLSKSKYISSQIAMTITDDNFHEMRDVLSLGQNLGVNSYSFMRKRTVSGLEYISEDYYKAMRELIIYAARTNINVNIHDYTLNNIIVDLCNNELISKSDCDRYIDMNSCHAYKELLLITPCGDVYPCMFSINSIGNIYNDFIYNILKRGVKENKSCIC